MRFWLRKLVLAQVFLLFFVCSRTGFAQTGITNEGPFSLLRTGSSDPLLTLHRTGTQWAPPTPGGLIISPLSIDRQSLFFPSFLQPPLPFTESYEVTFSLPTEFLSRTHMLFFDLFDNQDTNRSLAFVRSMRLTLPIGFQSSAQAAGPYATEDGFEVDPVNQILSLPKFSRSRYYRIQSDFNTRIVSFGTEGEDLVLAYRITRVESVNGNGQIHYQSIATN